MTGPKLNEFSFVAGEKTGTKAVARWVRMSASKARPVLDLIRNKDVQAADEILQFTNREAAHVIRKLLASAVANAQNNDELDPETLYVKACFADEGPTLKRFRPRARGRAGRINKRTCHLTIVVGQLSDVRLAVLQAKNANKGVSPATAARRARVERSRQRAAESKNADTATSDTSNEAASGAAESSESVEEN
jgi:large subunit ribosomal protein L22